MLMRLPFALTLFTAGFVGLLVTGRHSQADGAEEPPHTKSARRTSLPVEAEHGMVATSQPLAAQVGVDILRRGGNAADAAVAANAMLGLVEPMNCGPGGDLFCIYWDAKSGRLYGLNASGRSPYALSRAVLQKKGLTRVPLSGPLPWTVPGCVDGWHMLLSRFGTMTLSDVLAPAIKHAEDGFAVTPVIAGEWRGAERELRGWRDSADTFLPGGRAPRAGETFRNRRLAATYRALAAGGRDAFYRGTIAQKIVAFSQANGGYLALKDFADHRGEWVDPVSTSYRGYNVWEMPPNTQGIAVLEMLNLLEPYDLAAMGPGSADYLHLLVEAKKLAFADRAKYYADPAAGPLPVRELISKEYARRRGTRIDRTKAATEVPPGDPRLEHGDTIYLTVVDKDRNCCSLIQSLYAGFGSKVVPGDVGFAMQNRGALFALGADHVNRLEPHKRPFHTIIPAMVTHGGQPWFCFGVMGGDMQPQGQVQVLVNLIDFKMDVQAAGASARLRHFGSAEPTGALPAPDGGTVVAEAGISDAAVAALQARGHHVARGNDFGGYQGILIDQQRHILEGGSDPRKDGAAVGY